MTNYCNEIKFRTAELSNKKIINISDVYCAEVISPDLIKMNLENNNIRDLEGIGGYPFINVSSNNISRVSTKLPKTLLGIYLNDNQVTDLSELDSDRLRMLSVEDNMVFEIPKLPDSIQELNLTNNHIKELKNLPNDIKILRVFNNPITAIYELPETISLLDIDFSKIKDISTHSYDMMRYKEHSGALELFMNEVIVNLVDMVKEFNIELV